MKWWSPAHQALLNALDAQDVVPSLFEMLSDGAIQATERDTRLLRDWPEALRDSPAWSILADAMKGGAHLDVWEAAQIAGFTDRAAHHNALLLLELSERLALARHFETSLRCLKWSLVAWDQIYTSGYLSALAHDLDPQLPPESTAQILAKLLSPTLENRRQVVLEELRKSIEDLDRAALTHNHDWFETWRKFAPDDPASAEVRAGVAAFDQSASQLIAQRMTKTVADLDLTTADSEDIEAPFRLAWRQIAALRFPAPAMCEVIGQLISTLWTLRRVGRDTADAFNELIDLGILVAPHLARTIETGESIGQNSRLADLYVFRAERDRGEPRREFLDLALKYCPGHRNASMLMSYLHLHDAQMGLLNLAKTIRPATARATLQGVHDDLRKAEAAFPLNEDLAKHREQFQKACFKNKIEPGAFNEK